MNRIIFVSVICAAAIAIYAVWFLANSYDFATYSQNNPMGIKANVIYDYPFVTCMQSPCNAPKTFQLNFTSKQGSEMISYNICDGINCIKKDNFEYRVINVNYTNSQNLVGSRAGYTSSHIILGDLPWKIGDAVNIKIKAIPVTLLENGSLISYPEKIAFLDLGESKIIEIGNKTAG